MTPDYLKGVIAIDPAGCGCMECHVGEYLPYDSIYLDALFELILNGEMSVPANNTQEGTLIIYRDSYGSVQHTTERDLTDGADYKVIPPNNEDPEDDNVVDVSDFDKYAEDEEKDKRDQLIDAVLQDEVIPANLTTSTFILFESSMDGSGIIELYNCSEVTEPIIIFDY